ncbi:GntR family transcriptional regulator [Citricoccus sp. GCM10030269]|uniref:GntR family transcriptional regulator n=1 Tax=Citricoccus sp. GCM10030269 TaxID=3273388 RepID=UPI00360CA416
MAAERSRGQRKQDDTRRVRDLLRSEVLSSDYVHFGSLPTEDYLQQDLEVSRAVVRDALSLLSDEGVVVRRQRLGTFPNGHRFRSDIAESGGVRQPTQGGIWAGNMHPQLLAWEYVPAAPPIAHALGLPERAQVLQFDYILWFEGVQLGYATNYIAESHAKLLDASMFKIDLYRMFKDVGIDVGESKLIIEAVQADEMDAELLGIDAGEPLTVMEQIAYDVGEIPFDFAVIRSIPRRIAAFSRVRHSRP